MLDYLCQGADSVLVDRPSAGLIMAGDLNKLNLSAICHWVDLRDPQFFISLFSQRSAPFFCFQSSISCDCMSWEIQACIVCNRTLLWVNQCRCQCSIVYVNIEKCGWYNSTLRLLCDTSTRFRQRLTSNFTLQRFHGTKLGQWSSMIICIPSTWFPRSVALKQAWKHMPGL